MVVKAITITLRAPWLHSLKEKRSELKSLVQKMRNRFNVSAAETDRQDVHQMMVITVAFVASNQSIADSMREQIIRFVEANTEAEIVGIEDVL